MNVERDDLRLPVVGTFEALGCVDEFGFSETAGEFEDGPVRDGETSKPHRATLLEQVFV